VLIEKKMYNTAIRYLWRMFREPTVSRVKVIMEILEIMDHFPQWEVVILILCQLQTDHNYQNRDKCKEAVCLVFQKCFKMHSEMAMEIIESIIFD
jgi:myo-inositol catabolism protein IolC